jgi:hypothetical protein
MNIIEANESIIDIHQNGAPASPKLPKPGLGTKNPNSNPNPTPMEVIIVIRINVDFVLSSLTLTLPSASWFIVHCLNDVTLIIGIMNVRVAPYTYDPETNKTTPIKIPDKELPSNPHLILFTNKNDEVTPIIADE